MNVWHFSNYSIINWFIWFLNGHNECLIPIFLNWDNGDCIFKPPINLIISCSLTFLLIDCILFCKNAHVLASRAKDGIVWCVSLLAFPSPLGHGKYIWQSCTCLNIQKRSFQYTLKIPTIISNEQLKWMNLVVNSGQFCMFKHCHKRSCALVSSDSDSCVRRSFIISARLFTNSLVPVARMIRIKKRESR